MVPSSVDEETVLEEVQDFSIFPSQPGQRKEQGEPRVVAAAVGRISSEGHPGHLPRILPLFG